jgi:hypothetical protein
MHLWNGSLNKESVETGFFREIEIMEKGVEGVDFGQEPTNRPEQPLAGGLQEAMDQRLQQSGGKMRPQPLKRSER